MYFILNDLAKQVAMLLLRKVGILAQNISHMKITASTTRMSGCLPLFTIFFYISSGEQYVKTFHQSNFQSGKTIGP